MTFDPKRVSEIKRIREHTGLGLRESVDLYEKFAGNADKAIERYRSYRQQSPLVVGDFKSKLAVQGYIVKSEKEPRLNGFYPPDMHPETYANLKRHDENVRIIELVDKMDADYLIGIAGA